MEAQKDLYFKRNAFGVAFVEFFWGLGFPVIMESTFLQIFLKQAGASDFLIGMVPSILILGISIFPLLSSYLTRNARYKRKIVLNLHVISSSSILCFGIFLFFVNDAAYILPAFFISYVIFSLCIGLTFPVWLNFLVKIFSEKKNVQGLSIMMISQNIAKIISAFFILNTVEKYSLSILSAAWIFLIAGLLFLTGSFFFLFTKELPGSTDDNIRHDSFFKHTKNTAVDMLKNKNLLKFLVGDMDHYVNLTILSFYANYATQYFDIKTSTAAGLFVCFIYSGSIFSNFILGTMDFLSLKQKYISTKILVIVTLLILIFFTNITGFLTASFLMGFARGTRSIIYSPLVKRLTNKEDSTGYFALAPLLTIIFGSGFPALFGKTLDIFSHLGSGSYKIVFLSSIIVVTIILSFSFMTDFENVKKC